MKRFLLESRGSVAVLGALSIPVIILAVGISADVTHALNQKSKAQSVADSASIVAVKNAKSKIAKGIYTEEAIEQAKKEAEAFLISNLETTGHSGDTVPSIELVRDGNLFHSSTSFKGTAANPPFGLFGGELLRYQIGAGASSEIQKFVEIHFVVDESISMGIGASPAEQWKLYNGIKCAIACHSPPGATGKHLDSGNLDRARATGAVLRIDVVRSAFQNSLKQLPELDGNAIQFALHTFTAKLDTEVPLTSDLGELLDGIEKLEIDGNWGKGGTAFRPTFKQLKKAVGISGDGESPDNPKKIVVFVTDGVETNLQHYDDGQGGKRTETDGWVDFAPTFRWPKKALTAQQGLDPGICDDFKSATKAELIVMSVEYLIPVTGGSGRFPWTQNNLIPVMESRAQECATSPDLAFHAETPEEIRDEIRKVVDEAIDLDATRLTH